MTEITKGLFGASKEIFENNKGSILRTIIYTIGHFAIAITVLMLGRVNPKNNILRMIIISLKSC